MLPLSTRMRPDSLDSFVGQSHFMYPESLIMRAIRNRNFTAAIFFGPPGTGKTTLARIIASDMDAEFCEINASSTGTKELKEIIDRASSRFYGLERRPTCVYVDEIHRWNKLQQDALLKALEEGIIRFIGSTTENPYFSINNAILSRVRLVCEFRRLTDEDIKRLLLRALEDEDKGLGRLNIKCSNEVLDLIGAMSSGDARVALDTLGFIAENIDAGETITEDLVNQSLQRKTFFYNKEDDKYDLLSALQKSIRGSDPDGAVHYIARLIEGGADPMTIGRRLLVIASEDVGMAYPGAISIVESCVSAANMIGFPEARINLAQAAILLACSPKSNSVITAIDEAIDDVRKKDVGDIPLHLKDSHYSGAQARGIGLDYKYPHAFGGYVKQQYLPDNLERAGVRYYRPLANGKEPAFGRFLEEIKKYTK